MKKEIKIIIFIIILVIIFILIIGAYKLCQNEKYTCIIKSIENNIIVVQLSDPMIELTSENDIIELPNSKYYTFSVENVLIKDSKGRKIKNSNLKVGDKIDIISEKEKAKADIAYKVEPLQNIKTIKVLDNN